VPGGDDERGVGVDGRGVDVGALLLHEVSHNVQVGDGRTLDGVVERGVAETVAALELSAGLN
jgi:hypothetical protein